MITYYPEQESGCLGAGPGSKAASSVPTGQLHYLSLLLSEG